jgi:hypothetical protein
MVELLEKAFLEAQALPAETQEELAHILLSLIGSGDVIQLTAEEDADLAEAEAEVARGEIATDEEVEAVFSKFRR